jgi:hypothetical protein
MVNGQIHKIFKVHNTATIRMIWYFSSRMNKLVYIYVPHEFVIGQVILKLLSTRLIVAMVNKTVGGYFVYHIRASPSYWLIIIGRISVPTRRLSGWHHLQRSAANWRSITYRSAAHGKCRYRVSYKPAVIDTSRSNQIIGRSQTSHHMVWHMFYQFSGLIQQHQTVLYIVCIATVCIPVICYVILCSNPDLNANVFAPAWSWPSSSLTVAWLSSGTSYYWRQLELCMQYVMYYPPRDTSVRYTLSNFPYYESISCNNFSSADSTPVRISMQ